MSLETTSSIVWWTFRPLIAANMLRIIGTSLPFPAASSREVRPLCGWCVSASGDDGAVDVGEDLLLHVRAIHRRDHGAVRHRDHERGRVDEHHGRARALAGGERDAVLEARQRLGAEVDPA